VICSIAFENARWPRRAGFTLMEMAVALFIIALLLGSLMVPLTTQVESRNYAETQRILEQAREALIGFAAANGRLPCPASATSNGVEDGNTATGVCNALTVFGANVYYGFLPAATLGFTPVDSSGFAVDAWGSTANNRIRYAVSSLPFANPTFTRPGGMRSVTMASMAALTNLLQVCSNGTNVSSTISPYCNSPQTERLASNVPVVIWSVGANAGTTGGTSTDERQNPNPTAGFSADRIFVSKTQSGVTGSEFDDVVTWIGLPALFNRLIAAGQLP
jgi:prepilin-type N-terminal cleavage/methylation domain-containing protein